MSHRLALLLLALAAPLVLVTSFWRVPGGELLFAGVTVFFPVALMALGASRRGSAGPVRVVLGLLLVVLLVVVAGLFVFRGQVDDGPWWGGLPMAAAFQLYGLFLLPFLVSSLGYARTFEGWSLPKDALDRLRIRFPKTRDDPPVPGP